MRALRSSKAVRPATRDDTRQMPASRPQWSAWAKAWLGLVVIAFLNGVLHRGYEGPLGELRAHQLSSAVLLVLVAPWVWWIERRHPLSTRPAAAQVGLFWAAATVAFEFTFGHYVNQDSWATLAHDYDLRDGRLWLLDVIGIAAAPALARAWRLRRHRASTGV